MMREWIGGSCFGIDLEEEGRPPMVTLLCKGFAGDGTDAEENDRCLLMTPDQARDLAAALKDEADAVDRGERRKSAMLEGGAA